MKDIIVLAFVSVTAMLFQNCGVTKQPKVEIASMSSALYKHSGTETSCNVCHAGARPAEATGVKSARSTGSVFFHSATYKGNGDCVLCHSLTPNLINQTWSSGVYDHKDINGAKVTSCSQCHSGTRPTGAIGTPPFNHATQAGGMGDCVACHLNVGVQWSQANFSHTPTPISCNSCHSSTRPNPTLLTPPNQTKNLYLHSTQFNGTADCVGCHTTVAANVGIRWAGGFYNHMDLNNAKVATCTACHGNERPVGVVGNPPYDHAVGGLGDCATCHKTPGTSWTGGTFVHTPSPASCTSCHVTDRPNAATYVPAGTTKDIFVHSTIYKGDTDCVTCHTSVVANIGVRWAGGKFDHKTNAGVLPSTCVNCHLGNRPVGPVGNPAYDHANGGTGDCIGCHTSAGVTWVTTMFNHSPTPTSCNTCHASARPAPTALLPAGATKDQYLHSVGFNGSADCVSCHTSVPANVGVRWAGGTYNHKTNANTNVATCTPCHDKQRPVGLIGNPPYDHANGGTGDCVSCHKNIGTVWSGGQFSHTPTPTSCNTCHLSARPSAATLLPVGAKADQYQHATQFNGLGDCVGCHIRATANIGVRWSGGSYNHLSNTGATVTSCSPCHDSQRPIGPVGTPPFDHASGGTGDCATCHKAVGTTFKGGMIAHTPVPASCVTCHASQKPAGTVPNTRDGFNHLAAYGTECKTCHTVVTANIGVRWSGGFFNHLNNNAAALGTCSPCHDTREHKAGQLCTSCHKNVKYPIPANTTKGYSGGSWGDG